jgi:hypothetical protein
MKCNKTIGTCTCPDIEERLASVSRSKFVAIKFCKRCNQHYARCKCPDPQFEVRGGQP